MKGNKGQAMIETLLIVVTLTVITFGALQVVIMAVNDLSVNEAVFTVSRVAAVSGADRMSERSGLASAAALIKDTGSRGIYFHPVAPVAAKKLPGFHSGTYIDIMDTRINYVQNVMFSRLAGVSGARIGGMAKRSARALAVKLPDEEYYAKTFKDPAGF